MGKYLVWLITISLVFSFIVIFLKRLTSGRPRILSSTDPAAQTVEIGLVGDLGLGRFITANARNRKDFDWSFAGVHDWLTENEFNLANLESPIVENCPTVVKDTMIFCGDPQFLPALKKNKFILSLANNHIYNYGKSGFVGTKDYLSRYGISYIPGSGFYSTEINSNKFGFLAYDLVSNPSLKSTVIADIKKYDSRVDWLIVSLHWGNEYLSQPEQWRIDLAHRMVDAGADIIAGHHPHVVQPVESYKDKLIFYSLGNFIFDQNWSKATSESEIYKLSLSRDRIIQVSKTPIRIINNSRPEIKP